MTVFDWTILGAYMLVVLLIGVVTGRSNRSDTDYFQGGRSLPWYAVAISVGMTMLSAGAFISNPGWIYYDGLLAGASNLTLPLCIVFCTCTILPILYHTKVTTMGQFVNLRFGGRTGMITLLLWLLNSFVLTGGFVYTPSLVLESITGVSLDVWVPLIMILAIAYTVSGGIKAVIWTDTLQGILLAIGAVIALIVAFRHMGMPFGEVLSIAGEAGKTVSFDFDLRLDNYNIYLCLLGSFVMWVSYFGFNQEQIQRYVTSRSIRDVKKTGILSTVLMVGIYWMTYILGLILFVFYQNNASTLDFANSNNVFVDFIIRYMPSGMVGLMVAGVFAAAMSSLDSILNSATAAFVKDVYEPYLAKGKKATMKQSMLFTCAIAVVAVIFVYLYLSGSNRSIMQSIGAMSAPMQGTLTGVLLMILFMPFVNDKSCSLGCVAGFVLSLLVKSLESGLNINWLWCYVYSTAFAILFSCLFSLFFQDPEARARALSLYAEGRQRGYAGLDGRGWLRNPPPEV
ncbi:MAG: sodium/solute symporter [Oscillibacter sp.]|nr:sodium/solute symporter [Oscillibacter sp.]